MLKLHNNKSANFIMCDKKTRLRYIDSLRGIAIIAVLIFHYIPFASDIYSISYGTLYQYSLYGEYGVHLFFIISGYVIYLTLLREKSPVHFAFSRFSRLYPAFWVSVTLSSTLIFIFGHPVNAELLIDLPTYLINLSMFQRFFLYPSIDGVYWTLTFELMFYIYMGLIMLFGFQKKSYIYSLLWLIFSISFTYYTQVIDIELSERWKGLFLLEFISYFVTGIAIYKFKNDHNLQKMAIIIILSCLQQYLIAGAELSIVFGVVTSLFILFSYSDGFIVKILSPVGKISYSLYLIHNIPGFVLMKYLSTLGIAIIPNVTITTCTVIIMSWLTFKIVETPSKTILRDWFNRLRLQYNHET